LIGPFIFFENLNGARYAELLTNQIIPALREIFNQEEMNEIWFQQDGCPAHNTLQVQEILRDHFNDRVISNNGPVSWPARSPDISPLDFYLWGAAKNEIYEFDPPETIAILQERTVDVLRSINRNTIRRVCRAVKQRCQRCIEENGRHFQQFR
jgi:hypothetical protein